jgi:hypothetical protein
MTYRKLSGAVFAIVAIGHAARAAAGLPLVVGTESVPIWVSWVFAGSAAVLALWAFGGRK